MIATIAQRPFRNITIDKWFQFYRKINWLWWLQRIPMFALAVPAAYGVGAFSNIDNKLPIYIAAIAGIAFESTYIGTIALGDQMTDDDRIGLSIWFGLNFFAVVFSALFSTLYFSGGKYADVTAESITHGASLPIVNFFYGFLLHWVSTQSNRKATEDAALTKEHCEYCNIGKPNRNAVISHYRYCIEKLDGHPKRFTTDGKRL